MLAEPSSGEVAYDDFTKRLKELVVHNPYQMKPISLWKKCVHRNDEQTLVSC